jgi:hypothetical protein
MASSAPKASIRYLFWLDGVRGRQKEGILSTRRQNPLMQTLHSTPRLRQALGERVSKETRP